MPGSVGSGDLTEAANADAGLQQEKAQAGIDYVKYQDELANCEGGEEQPQQEQPGFIFTADAVS